jgi:leader peptidase (prepilin peptidase)/N-methyltransferase
MLENIAALPAGAHIALGALFGLLVGSFLNVVIYRYPNLLKYQWTVQSKEWLSETTKLLKETPSEELGAPPGIIKPPSHCSHCKAPVRAWQNIPVLSFLLLGGKCASCDVKLPWRYPLVELLTAILSAVVVYEFGFSFTALCGVILTWVLVCLAFIDIDHQILPDDIVLPTLWAGLTLSLFPVFADPQSAIIGAVAGYLTLWLVFHLFKLLTGKEGMGYGDFKLLAVFGAWLGWQFLPQIILISTILGSVIGITLIATKKAQAGKAIPFGPYIAAAGWLAMLYGEQINQAYLRFSGL